MTKNKLLAKSKETNKILREMSFSYQRVDFIGKCLAGICKDCGDILDGKVRYCQCDD